MKLQNHDTIRNPSVKPVFKVRFIYQSYCITYIICNVCVFFLSDHSCKIDKNIMLNHAWQCKNNVQRIRKWLLNIRKHPIRVMLHKWFKTISSGIDFSINQTPGSRLDRYLSIKKPYLYYIMAIATCNQLYMSHIYFSMYSV